MRCPVFLNVLSGNPIVNGRLWVTFKIMRSGPKAVTVVCLGRRGWRIWSGLCLMLLRYGILEFNVPLDTV